MRGVRRWEIQPVSRAVVQNLDNLAEDVLRPAIQPDAAIRDQDAAFLVLGFDQDAYRGFHRLPGSTVPAKRTADA